MSRSLLFWIAGCVLGTALGVGAQSRPPMPFIDKGACPFECCTYREWTVDKPTLVHSAMRDGAPVAFRLRRGERVRGLTGTVITERAGEVKILKRAKIGDRTVNAGDTVYLLTYAGEGFHKVWLKGKVVEGDVTDETKFRRVRSPKSVWWVKIRNGGGKIGWSREPDNFGNKDQCGR